MHSAVMEFYGNEPEKIIDLEWLEEELHRINDDANLILNRKKKCVQHHLRSEQEFQLLYRWSEHVGAKLEVQLHNAFIYC
jgi:hypothetical protein